MFRFLKPILAEQYDNLTKLRERYAEIVANDPFVMEIVATAST